MSLTWLVSPPLARATNDRPAVMFQSSDSYTCSTISLECKLHVSSQLGPARWVVASTMGGVDRFAICTRAAYEILACLASSHISAMAQEVRKREGTGCSMSGVRILRTYIRVASCV